MVAMLPGATGPPLRLAAFATPPAVTAGGAAVAAGVTTHTFVCHQSPTYIRPPGPSASPTGMPTTADVAGWPSDTAGFQTVISPATTESVPFAIRYTRPSTTVRLISVKKT